MKKADNDNDEFSFVSLAALTANVTRYLRLDEQKDKEGHERERSDEAEKRATERSEFVNRRLRELDRFEDRARGKRNKV